MLPWESTLAVGSEKPQFWTHPSRKPLAPQRDQHLFAQFLKSLGVMVTDLEGQSSLLCPAKANTGTLIPSEQRFQPHEKTARIVFPDLSMYVKVELMGLSIVIPE